MIRHGIFIPEDKLSALCKHNHIRRLALFGSVLRDDFRPESDLDMLVEFETNVHLGLRFFELECQLSTLFGRRVDLNTPAFLGKAFREEVLREAENIYDAA